MEMKDSGIAWIGEIPNDWEISLLSSLFFEHSLKNIGMQENNLLSLSYGKIIRKNIDENGGLLPASFEGYNIISPNDIVFRLTDLQNDKRSLRTGLCTERGIITSAYITIRKRDNNLSSRYFHYLLHSYDECKVFYGIGNGVRQGMNYQDLRKLLLVNPPTKEEQSRIANFLDKKCVEIDELIALQEQMIAQLNTYKQAVITETVTKGLDPNVKMKDSGVEWIGEIPEHWDVAKSKYFVSINNGSDPKTEGDIPVYGSGAASFKTCGEYKIGPTVLIGRKGATLHIPHYIEGKYWNVDTAFDVKSKNNMILRFYYYLAICFDYKFYISQTTLPGMAQSSYYNMLIPVPGILEQQSIADYLNQKCKDIDELISVKKDKIEKLKAYKKSVIFEYVTGKKQTN